MCALQGASEGSECRKSWGGAKGAVLVGENPPSQAQLCRYVKRGYSCGARDGVDIKGQAGVHR